MSIVNYSLFKFNSDNNNENNSISGPSKNEKNGIPPIFSINSILAEVKAKCIWTSDTIRKLAIILDESDTEDLFGNQINDGMHDDLLNMNEIEIVKMRVQEEMPDFYGVIKNFIDGLFAQSDEQTIANNFLLKLNDYKGCDMNNTLCEYTLEDLTTENLLDVLKEWKGSVPLLPFISTNSEGGFAMFYKKGEEGEEYQNKIIQKFKGFGDYLLNKAKEENIYCKDYEEKIQKYYEEGNLIFLSVEVGRLADRIIISTDNEKTLPASKRALELKEPNGQIDEAYVQGYTGDCWFIGALASICADKNAHDRLNQMITVNKENDEIKSVTVNIQGNEYQIDYEELKNANEYATGDLDIRAVEIALNRYLHDNELGDLDLGGDVIDGYKYLFGEENIIVNDFKNKKEADESEYMTIKNNDDYENQFNANEYIEEIKKHVNGAISTIGIYKNGTYEDNTSKFAIDKDGKKVELKAHHAYTYTRIDSEYYYFKDTHDLQNELKIKIDDFAKTFECGTIVELI